MMICFLRFHFRSRLSQCPVGLKPPPSAAPVEESTLSTRGDDEVVVNRRRHLECLTWHKERGAGIMPGST